MTNLKSDLNDPRGAFPIIVSELATISKKLESGGGVNVQGHAFSHYMDSTQWFLYHKGFIAIFVDGVAMLHAMIATMNNTSSNNRAKEASKKTDMGSYIEAAIKVTFTTLLPYILVGNMKEITCGAY